MRGKDFGRSVRGKTISGAMLAASVCCFGPQALASDWPMYRHDPGRTASSDEQLSQALHLQWSRQFPALIPAWLGEFPHLRFDDHYEPIVLGKTLFFGSSVDDSVTALDTETGRVRWRFYANGPVRLAPVASKGRVYFGADDGVVYCLDAGEGTLLWKFDTALSRRRGFVEGRLGTICPVRGGPIVENGQVHCAAGIWAFEACAFFTVDAETGKLIRRVNGIRAQGYLAAAGQWLRLPNGRAGAFRLRRSDGAPAGGVGGWAGYWDHLIAGKGEWFVRMGSLQKTGKAPSGVVCEPGPGRSPICFYRPVIAADVVYYSAAKKVRLRVDKPGPEVGDLVACSLKDPQMLQAKDAKGKPVLSRAGKPQTKLLVRELWRLPNSEIVRALQAEGRALVILELKAGKRLYGHRGSTVFAVDLPVGGAPPTVSWKASVKGTPARMLAADAKLFVVTREGGISCFGDKKVTPKEYPKEEHTLVEVNDEWSQKATAIVDATGADDGYCLVLGLKSGRLVEELFRRSRLHIIAMDKGPELARALRDRLSYLAEPARAPVQPQTAKDGTPLTMAEPDEINPRRRRVVVYEDDPLSYPFPPYIASLIVSEDPKRLAAAPARIQALFHADRRPMRYDVIPHAVFSAPQVAGVGLTEEELRAQARPYKVGRWRLADTAMGMALREDGLAKVLAAPDNTILGCHILAPNASVLIHEVAVAMTAGDSLDAIVDTVHAHPALSQLVEEACKAALTASPSEPTSHT